MNGLVHELANVILNVMSTVRAPGSLALIQHCTAVMLFELRKTVKIIHCQFLFGVCLCV